LFCTNCGNELAQTTSTKFCSSCGKSLDQKGSNLRSNAEKTGIALDSVIAKARLVFDEVTRKSANVFSKLDLKKIALIATSVIVGMAILAGGIVFGVNQYRLTVSDKVTLSTVFSETEVTELAKQQCAFAEDLLLPSSQMATYRTQLDTLISVAGSPNSRGILKYQNAHDWTLDTLLNPDTALNDKLKNVMDSQLSKNPRIVDTSYSQILNLLTSQLKDAVLSKCGIVSAFSQASLFADQYNQAQIYFSEKADSAPWYPNGYYERYDGLDKLAYKWVERGYDCYSCYQWDMNVISRDGCYGGVYAKINVEKSGTVLDWDNDTIASLGSEQVGQMTFQSYLEGFGTLTANLLELTCSD
jgi:hypothetical protein